VTVDGIFWCAVDCDDAGNVDITFYDDVTVKGCDNSQCGLAILSIVHGHVQV
jgi:hypothetical protein